MAKIVPWPNVRGFYESLSGITEKAAILKTAKKFGLDWRSVERRLKAEKWKLGILSAGNVIDFKSPSPLLAGRVPDSPADHLALVSHAIFGFGTELKDLSKHDLSKAAAAANAMCKLIELHRVIQPPTATMLADAAINAGITPQEFMEALGMQWQQRA